MVLRKCKHDTSIGYVYARLTVDSQQVEISTKEKVDFSDWNAKVEKVDGRTMEVKAINDHLGNVRFKIKEKYRELVDKNCLVTAQAVKEAYLGTHTGSKGHKFVELLDYFRKIWEGKMKPGGFKNYKTTIDYIKAFLSKFPAKDIYLSQLNMELATEFEYYVRNHPLKKHDPCLGNGIAKHIQRFKRIINWAKEIQWIKTNPCQEYSCPQKKTKRKKLTIQEVVALEQKEFADAQLAYVKDIFLLSCFMGLAYVDVMALKGTHFEWDVEGIIWCKIYRTKSDELCPVPLLRSAACILNKYRSASLSSETNIFPRITNQQVNRSLKIIRSACDIVTPMTFHVARHTFAKTIALKNGIPLETVQMMMGHTKITTTQIYADVDEEKIIEDMNGIDEKLDKKRKIVWEENAISGLVNSNRMIFNL
jgi:integrase/recombinase XerD